jgi:hypothetical protein
MNKFEKIVRKVLSGSSDRTLISMSCVIFWKHWVLITGLREAIIFITSKVFIKLSTCNLSIIRQKHIR